MTWDELATQPGPEIYLGFGYWIQLRYTGHLMAYSVDKQFAARNGKPSFRSEVRYGLTEKEARLYAYRHILEGSPRLVTDYPDSLCVKMVREADAKRSLT